MALAVFSLAWMTAIYACADGSMTSASWRNFDRLRQSNCTRCSESLEFNIADVLPRLEMIKQKILHAIGKSSVQEHRAKANTSHAPNDVSEADNDHGAAYTLNEIVSTSKSHREYIFPYHNIEK